MSGKIVLKKYSIYEFQLEVGGELVDVIYKKDDEKASNSHIIVNSNNGDGELKIPVELFAGLYDALNEIDPYGFIFSDLEEDE